MRTFQTEVPARTFASSRHFFFIAPLLFVLAAVVYNVIAYASVGTVGGELYAISRKTEQITLQNQKLTEELARKQSLHDAIAAAQNRGFVPISRLTQVTPKDMKVALGVSSTPIHE